MSGRDTGSCPICDIGTLKPSLEYRERPVGETDFGIPADQYRREYLRCDRCGHFYARANFDFFQLYQEKYVTQTYGSDFTKRFTQIRALPQEKSDNFARVERVKNWMTKKTDTQRKTPTVLDVGSGLCVFLDLLKHETGWTCVALDPDARQAAHARDTVGIEAIHADFLKFEDPTRKFDLITLNKVLEHVFNPIFMLKRAASLLPENGMVYVELPDADGALADSQYREEFFIDHLHVFSLSSARILAEKSGLIVERAEQIREPSGKYTLFLFLKKTA